ncbi:MAG: flavodoxin [Methanobacteriaceae archaeon]|nr:flavodoxin [Methanobacteriaceae archaeon]
MKSIVIYYSRTGNTKEVANIIKDRLGSDLVEIKSFDSYDGTVGFIKGGFNAFRNSKTKITPNTVNLSEYDLVFVGTPVWASKPTPMINSILSNCDFSNKKIITYITTAGSGAESTHNSMKTLIESNGGTVFDSFSVIEKDEGTIKEKANKALDKLNI